MAFAVLSSFDNRKYPAHYDRSNFWKYYGLNQWCLLLVIFILYLMYFLVTPNWSWYYYFFSYTKFAYL